MAKDKKDKKDKKPLKTIISEFFFNIWSKVLNWYRVSKFGAITQQIGWFIGYALWPLSWIKARTFDKLRFDIQKKVVSMIFLLPVVLGFIIFFAYPLVMSFIYSFSTVRLTSAGVDIMFNQFFSNFKRSFFSIFCVQNCTLNWPCKVFSFFSIN